jgi:hypothetical protein
MPPRFFITKLLALFPEREEQISFMCSDALSNDSGKTAMLPLILVSGLRLSLPGVLFSDEDR